VLCWLARPELMQLRRSEHDDSERASSSSVPLSRGTPLTPDTMVSEGWCGPVGGGPLWEVGGGPLGEVGGVVGIAAKGGREQESLCVEKNREAATRIEGAASAALEIGT
jgi:hypothetical protein